MLKSYVVTCSLIEILNKREAVLELVRSGNCIGYSGIGDAITFHFSTRGDAMMVFLGLETILDCLSVSTSPMSVDKNNLKGVFKYDQN